MAKKKSGQRSVLEEKRVLAVDDEPDVLDILCEEIKAAAPSCTVDTAVSHKDAVTLMASWTYDLAIFDIMGVRGLDLLRFAVERENPLPVVMLTARALTPEVLKGSIELGARAFLPKEHLGDVVPFLEDVLTNEYGAVWRRILSRIEGLFNDVHGPYWRNPDAQFWKDFEAKLEKSGKG